MLSGMQSMNTRIWFWMFGFWTSAFGALFVATLLVVATSSSFATEPSASDPAQVTKGKALYGTNCLREFPHDDKARFVNSVTHGKNNRMPPWGDILKPEDIDNLWAYVLTGGKP
jgi:cytochrome c55X